MRERERAPWRLGLIGAGRFGRFCLEQIEGWERVKATVVTDVVPAWSELVAKRFGLAASETPEALLARDDVDLVLVSTPPDTHAELTCAALRAGKHVICEKPLALTAAEADEAIRLARETDRLLNVNHMLRYSALLEAVTEIVRRGPLGAPLHAFFENYAEDEHLPPEHWFWDRARSGGIFVEHAVHFFDLHHWWFGPGQVLAAHREVREGTGQVDRVWCATRAESGVLVHQYHGFDQPSRLDRADHRIVFERGQVVVHGWVPLELHVMGIMDHEQEAQLSEICRGCRLEEVEHYSGEEEHCRGRGQSYRVEVRVLLDRQLAQGEGLAGQRGRIYGDMIKRLLDDQLTSLEDPRHVPRLRAEDAREAVARGEEANALAGGPPR